jgi:hypothetical protein
MRSGSCIGFRKVDPPLSTDAEVEALVVAFEEATLPYSRWTHRAHLAVAVVYLTRYRFELALDRVRLHIQLYNGKRGKADGYHETISVAHMVRVAAYLRSQVDPPTLTDAVAELTTLCGKGWLTAHYSPGRLASAEAKAGWVEPDLAPLDDWG